MSFAPRNTALWPRSVSSIPTELVIIALMFLLPVISTVETTLFKGVQIAVVLVVSLIAILRLITEERLPILWHDVLALGFLLTTMLYTYTSPVVSADFVTASGNLLLFSIVSVAFYRYYKHVFAGFVFSGLLYAALALTQPAGRLQLLGLQPNAGLAQLAAIAVPFVARFSFQDGFFTKKSAVGTSGLIALLYLGQQTGTRTFLLVLPIVAVIAAVGNTRFTIIKILGLFVGITLVSGAVGRVISAPVWQRLSVDAILIGITDRLAAYRPILANIDQLAFIGVGYSRSPEIINEIGPHNMFLTSVLRFGFVSTILLFGLVVLLSRDCLRAISHRREKNVFIFGACGALLVHLAQLQFHHGLTWDATWIFFGAVAGMIKAELVSSQIKQDIGINSNRTNPDSSYPASEND